MTDEPRETAPRPLLEELFRFSHGHRVRYDEVDAQGIVGNASWLNLIQLGRIEYLRYLGLMLEGGSRSPVQAVVRRAVVDYLAPARFDDALAIRARLEYIVDNIDTGLRPVTAETVIVCVEMATMRSIAWPEFWRQRVMELEGENVRVGQG